MCFPVSVIIIGDDAELFFFSAQGIKRRVANSYRAHREKYLFQDRIKVFLSLILLKIRVRFLLIFRIRLM